ncbi:uncharacterized protein CMU_026240 [Cryptosporidium muris RN66]|uniref:GPI ethanolamine phosphate transferase 3 n=1 Tax=Cryptosporidium muris (strain RN66) TaxID=441375 RepID=B6AB65_CRYMR|nr:uncharacterized protein CMU_026240 [Cryptosporidium muris RN66]EEA05617.1 hypothetical protein, conserved [Cryptosporidium muris RN66]|eukprot:XP_002139966.1 hypothetical protein [Cryptosporidium muris RN66]
MLRYFFYICTLTLGTFLFCIGYFGPVSQRSGFKSEGTYSEDFKVEYFNTTQIYDKIIITLVDALRWDFVAFVPNSHKHYHNKFKFIQSILKDKELNQYCRLYKFRSDAPTATTHRLNALMTGTIPRFIDLWSTFNPKYIKQETILQQLHLKDKKIAILGDDTWNSLFSKYIDYNHYFPSFDIRDINSVDDGIINNLWKYLDIKEINEDSESSFIIDDWTLLVAHFLGVDHIGHLLNINNPTMALKLQNMEQVFMMTIFKALNIKKSFNENIKIEDTIIQIVEHLKNLNSKRILFLLFGDHGQTDNGEHGGNSEQETDAAFFAFSNIKYNNLSYPRNISEPHILHQIDFVPTLASLLGINIPNENIGVLSQDLLPDINSDEYSLNSLIWKTKSAHNNALQMIKKFKREFSKIKEKENFITEKYSLYYESYIDLKDYFGLLNSIESEYSDLQINKKIKSKLNRHLKSSIELSHSIQKVYKDNVNSISWIYVVNGISILICLILWECFPQVYKKFFSSFGPPLKLPTPIITLIIWLLLSSFISYFVFKNKFKLDNFLLLSISYYLFYNFFTLKKEFSKSLLNYYKLIYKYMTVWDYYWCIITTFVITIGCNLSDSLVFFEARAVRFLLVSYNILYLIPGHKRSLKGLFYCLIQLILIRIGYLTDPSEGRQGESPNDPYYTSSLNILTLLLHYLFIVIHNLDIINFVNLAMMFGILIYLQIYTIDCIWLPRIYLIFLIYIIYLNIHRYQIQNDSKQKLKELSLKNIWISCQVFLYIMLQKNQIIAFSLSYIVQICSIEMIKNDLNNLKDRKVASLKSSLYLYLVSKQCFFNIGNRPRIDKIPSMVGLIGLKYYTPFVSSMMVVLFLCSHLLNLLLCINMEPLINKTVANSTIMVFSLINQVFSCIGLCILRHNLMIWTMFAPKFVYQVVFNLFIVFILTLIE